MRECVYASHHVWVPWKLEDGADPLKMEFQEIARHLLRVLGSEFRPSARTANAPNHRAISAAPSDNLYKQIVEAFSLCYVMVNTV